MERINEGFKWLAIAGITIVVLSMLIMVYQMAGGYAVFAVVFTSVLVGVVAWGYTYAIAQERIRGLLDKLYDLYEELDDHRSIVGIKYTQFLVLMDEVDRSIEYLEHVLETGNLKVYQDVYQAERQEVDDLICQYLNNKDEYFEMVTSLPMSMN